MRTFKEITLIVASAIDQISWKRQPRGLYEPIEYVLALGGKRIRPSLTLMGCNLYSDQIDLAIPTALGIEIFHNFTLLHDDIMDKAPIRRGRETVHIKWDDNTAILSGDVMQIVAYQYIAQTPVAQLKEVLDLFSVTAAEICEGQQYDVEFESRDRVEAVEYLEMIRLKTAVLLGCSLKSGALIGGAPASDAQHLYDFGINIGLAFQLKDDMLDVYGDEKTFGKKIGGDILCNKKTYLLIHALQLAEGALKEELDRWLNTNEAEHSEEKIEKVTYIYNQLGVRQICEAKMDYFYHLALQSLDKVSVEISKKQELIKLAEKLMARND